MGLQIRCPTKSSPINIVNDALERLKDSPCDYIVGTVHVVHLYR